MKRGQRRPCTPFSLRYRAAAKAWRFDEMSPVSRAAARLRSGWYRHAPRDHGELNDAAGMPRRAPLFAVISSRQIVFGRQP
jgi:hypothetical protein